jgi:hypothetical protein
MTDDPIGPDRQSPGPDIASETAASSVEGVVSTPLPGEPTRSAPPTLPGLPAAKRYTGRFLITYLCLGVVLAGAVTGLILVVTNNSSGIKGSSSWSNWKPVSGTTASVTNQIANHVAQEYKLNSKGTQLVAVVSDPPQVTSGTHKVSISHLAIKSPAAKTNAGIQIFSSAQTWTDQFCGLGASCSIATGAATPTRGRLVRREALEVALYTFKFVPKISSVIAFMPPPPGETATTLLYLQKSDYAKQLSEPLRQTLPLAKPPLPNAPDTSEAATIDRLTLPSVYSYTLQQLQDSSALLVLSPFSS